MPDNPFMRLRCGESVVYHRGLLALDAARGFGHEQVKHAKGLAWKAYEAGRVALVQRRVSKSVIDGGCEYIAVGL